MREGSYSSVEMQSDYSKATDNREERERERRNYLVTPSFKERKKERKKERSINLKERKKDK